MRIKQLVFVLLSSSLIFPSSVFAHHRDRVLAATITTQTPVLPATAEGPGLILPDSPLFFLDEVKQNMRLFFALTPEAKAQVYQSIAGERLAELRYMLAKNNQQGIKIALDGFSNNTKQAAVELAKAQFAGKNVQPLAETVNQAIKERQKSIDSLDMQTTGELKAQVNVVQDALTEAKIQVEDSLPKDQLEKEIQEDLEREIGRKVEDASESAKEVKHHLAELSQQASESAARSLKRREEAIKRAIEHKNEEMRKLEERKLEIERKNQSDQLELQKETAEHVLKATQEAQQAAQKLEMLRNDIETPAVTPTPSQTLGSGGSLTSGSSNSGGSSSGSGGSSDSHGGSDSSGSGSSESGRH